MVYFPLHRLPRPLPGRSECVAALAATLWLACLAPNADASEEREKHPNVVLIMADDVGWRDTSVYGSRFYETPELDAFAGEGMLFTDAYAANPLCSPTRASVLTGQYPARLRFTAPNGHRARVVLDPGESASAPRDHKATTPGTRTRLPNEAYHTIAEAFGEAGYHTAFMGKWHLGRHPYVPENQGFDLVRGGRYDPGPPAPGHYFSPWRLEGDTLPEVEDGRHIADVLAGEADAYLRERADSEKPFFLAYWPYDVHGPFQTKDPLREHYARKLADGSFVQQSPTMGGMIEVMDSTLGRVLDSLERDGLEEDTIVVVYSDNGGNMYNRIDGGVPPTDNAPLRAGKGNNYEGGVRVPLIVRWPGRIEPGSVSDALVSSPDLYPTLLELAGLSKKPEAHVDGHSFAEALRGDDYARPEPIFSHFPHYFPRPGNIPNTSLREGPWKLYKFWFDGPEQTHRYELYNLDTDIGENVDLAEIYPGRVERMKAEMQALLDETNALLPRKNPDYGEREIAYANPRTLYRDTFEGGTTGSLDGREPNTTRDAARWSAQGLAIDAGALRARGASGIATLPLGDAVAQGEVVVVTAELAFAGPPKGDAWVGLGFAAEPAEQAGLRTQRAWGLLRNAATDSPIRVNAFLRGTNGRLSRTSEDATTSEPVRFRAVYDTANKRMAFTVGETTVVSRDVPADLAAEAKHAFVRFHEAGHVRLKDYRVEIADAAR